MGRGVRLRHRPDLLEIQFCKPTSLSGGMNIAFYLAAFCAVFIIFTAISMSAQTKYFPADAFGDPKSSQDWIALYSKYLQSLKEPALPDHSQLSPRQSFRFLWLRSFHKPVSVRLDVRTDGTGVVTVKVEQQAGAFNTTTRSITKEQVDLFLYQIGARDFWRLPSQEEPVSGPDGARWVMEGIKGSQYHVVHRWAPKDGAVRTLCLYLAADLGRMKLESNEIY